MHRRPLEPHAAPQPVPTSRPRLLLRPLAFMKLTYLCHAAGTEVGGFGLSSEADPLVIEDILLVRQQATAVTVEFGDEAVADLIDDQADRGVPPQRCARVWVHTHPGSNTSPSGVDERTFARCFGGADFSVMLILPLGGKTYARLQLIGPVKTAVEIPVMVDWASLPLWLDEQRTTLPDLVQRWSMELDELVTQAQLTASLEFGSGLLPAADNDHGDLMDRVDLDELAFYEEAADERSLYY
jgi:hypothetical protein